MLITRTSMLSHKTRTREINITSEQLERWRNGTLIQEAAPHLSPDEREFIISGVTPEEWDSTFGDEDD